MVTRYVVTHIGKDGLRTLAQGAQGRYTYATREEAEAMKEAILRADNGTRVKTLYGLPLEVRPCECWPGHHDPKGIYFD